jgi:signal peptidase II
MNQSLRFTLLCLLLIAGVVADQVTKRAAAESLRNTGKAVLVPGILDLSYTENTGVVFGIGDDPAVRSPWRNRLPAVITAAGMLALIFFLPLFRRGSMVREAAVFTILSGAAGNLIDRLRTGTVVDFIHLHAGGFLDWPFLFNVADVLICAGAAILAADILFGSRPKK